MPSCFPTFNLDWVGWSLYFSFSYTLSLSPVDKANVSLNNGYNITGHPPTTHTHSIFKYFLEFVFPSLHPLQLSDKLFLYCNIKPINFPIFIDIIIICLLPPTPPNVIVCDFKLACLKQENNWKWWNGIWWHNWTSKIYKNKKKN